MKVLVAFERAYAGPLPDAIWLIETPDNRRWFELNIAEMDANSALFAKDADPLAIVWNVLDHHPDWTEVHVRGASLTDEMKASVQGIAKVFATSPGKFEFHRL